MMPARGLLALMRLASPALPIGGFSYSQGLETAIELGWVRNEADVREWLESLLLGNVGGFEAPLCRALFEAILTHRLDEADRLHARYLASRETGELRAETLQMGQSLLQVLAGLSEVDAGCAGLLTGWRQGAQPCALPRAWGLAARVFGLDADSALSAYLWAWLENQVMAAIKAVPLGQQAGQRLFSSLQPVLADVIEQGARQPECTWSNFAPGFALASSRHETQYSRLFRS